MESHEILHDTPAAESGQRPSIALVQHGILVGEYGPNEFDEADRAAARLALAGGYHVDVYEIDPRLPPAPPLGSVVDPKALHWVNPGY